MATLKTSLKTKKQELINFKVTEQEYNLIRVKANKFTKGNISEWIRYAAIQLEPKASDLV